jgi:hypothetical protein
MIRYSHIMSLVGEKRKKGKMILNTRIVKFEINLYTDISN